MKGTDMNKDGQTFVFQIALYYFKTVQVKSVCGRRMVVVDGGGGWLCVTHFSDQLIPI